MARNVKVSIPGHIKLVKKCIHILMKCYGDHTNSLGLQENIKLELHKLSHIFYPRSDCGE
jgi:hypothetical protein